MGPLAGDLAPALLDQIYRTMGLGHAWCLRSNRQLTWWHWRLAQTIVALPPADSLGTTVTRLVAMTDFLCDVPDTVESLASVFALNQMATMSAVIFDPEQRKARLACSALFNQENAPWLTEVFSRAALLQMAEACLQAEEAAGRLKCKVDASAHPEFGSRPEADDMYWIHRFRSANQPCRFSFDQEDTREAAALLRQVGFPSSFDGGDLFAQLPLLDSAPPTAGAGGSPRKGEARRGIASRAGVAGAGWPRYCTLNLADLYAWPCKIVHGPLYTVPTASISPAVGLS